MIFKWVMGRPGLVPKHELLRTCNPALRGSNLYSATGHSHIVIVAAVYSPIFCVGIVICLATCGIYPGLLIPQHFLVQNRSRPSVDSAK